MQKSTFKPTFFYGWVMLGISVLAAILTMPGQTAGVSLFAPSFEEALNLTRTQQTGAYAMGTFLASLAMTYVGAQMDRFGIRRVMGIVVILFGMACVYTGFVTGFWTLFIAFLFLRMFGQGSLSLLSQNTAAMWFDKRLGLTQGIIGIAFALGVAGMPPFVFWLLNLVSWRVAYPILGGIVVIVLIPCVLFFFVNRPEDIDQVMDGGWAPKLVPAESLGSGREFTLPEAMRTPAYWIISGMMFAVSMIVTGVTFNGLFLFESFGLTNAEAIAVLSLMGLSSAIAQLFAGWLADVFPMRWLAMINMAGQTLSMVILLYVNSYAWGIAFAITKGVFGALHQAVVGTMWPRYFGREHLGKIRGSVFTSTVAGSSLGPFVMGALFDRTGSYAPSIIIFAVIYGIFVILTPFAVRPSSD